MLWIRSIRLPEMTFIENKGTMMWLLLALPEIVIHQISTQAEQAK